MMLKFLQEYIWPYTISYIWPGETQFSTRRSLSFGICDTFHLLAVVMNHMIGNCGSRWVRLLPRYISSLFVKCSSLLFLVRKRCSTDSGNVLLPLPRLSSTPSNFRPKQFVSVNNDRRPFAHSLHSILLRRPLIPSTLTVGFAVLCGSWRIQAT
jgi:hypothetical protein